MTEEEDEGANRVSGLFGDPCPFCGRNVGEKHDRHEFH